MQFTKKIKLRLLIFALLAIIFYLFPIFYQKTFINYDNPTKVTKIIEQKLQIQEDEFQKIANDTTLLINLINKNYTNSDLNKFATLPFSFQIFNALSDSIFQISFWNKNNIIPNNLELLNSDGKYLSVKQNGYHQFVKKSVVLNNSKFIVSCIIPLYWNYFIETDYLKKEFTASTNIENKFEAVLEPTDYPIKNSDGSIIFYLQKNTDNRNVGIGWTYILCRILSFFFLIAFLFEICSIIVIKRNFRIAMLLFIGLMLIVRLFSMYNIYPFNNKILEYFDPRIYAANRIFKSLGDLTFNLVTFFTLQLFWIKYKNQNIFYDRKLLFNYSLSSIAKIILFVVSTYYTFWIFRSLIIFSKISFNVTNFFSLSIYSLIGFLHIAFLIIIYFFFTQQVLNIKQLLKQNSTFLYFSIAIVGILILFCNFYWANDSICIYCLIWMILYLYCSQKIIYTKSEKTIPFSIIWLLFFSFFSAILFQNENNIKEKQDRKWLAQKLAFQSDPNTESLLRIAVAKFDDNYLNSKINKFYNSNESIKFKDSLLSENFVGYLNKFQTKIFTFDSLERPLFNKDSTRFSYFNTIIQNQATRVSNINDLYFHEIGFDLFTYYFKKDIIDTSGKLLGYLIIQSTPINYKTKSTALSPELFKQRNTKLDDNGNNYIYAIYNNYELRKRFFDYDLPTLIDKNDIPIKDDTLKYQNGYEELWYKLNQNSVIVVGKKNNIFLSEITLFAYIFFSLLIIIILLVLGNVIIYHSNDKDYLHKLFQLNFSEQVQSIVWIISLLTFIIVAFVIISLFKFKFDKSNKERLSRTMNILIADVQNKINSNAVFDDVVKVYEPITNNELSESIIKISEIHNVDFNIYDLDGTLKLSSQPLIENKEILSNKIDPIAFYNLSKKKSAQFVQEEKMGTFKYLSMYVPIRDDLGKPYGYLSIPYYSSESDLNQEISNFLITIINLTAFIFLIAGLISWLVTNRITNSFSLIGNKMKDVSLGKNEIIEWKKDDEIGGLVKEYNKMVMKLEESAVVLARTEREGAWREMARQVAHEIKNPLTPMKLSVQYLQKSIEAGNDNIQELTKTVSKTLVEQIDHLSNIASNFSQFANLESSKFENIELIAILNSLQQLFNVEPKVSINITSNVNEAILYADKTQINRLFTNLIKNAIQAYNQNILEYKINIDLKKDENKLQINVQDFANGIPFELQDKIFTPNFTTKTSGTGLGLAICKSIVESTKGKIWFSTQIGKGTIFYIEFLQLQ